MTIVTPPPEIPRDRWGRPMVVPPNGGKAVAYTRCTTFIDVIEDKFNLQKWMQRMVALGLASRPDLLLSVSAHAEDKKQLDRICEDAREAASASAAATTGTALHALTELVDRGQDLPILPEAAKADLEAYREATEPLRATHIEQFCVQDPLRIGGTPDRVVEYQGERYIADIKTGSIEWGVLKIAMQLAVYARSHTYDVATGTRGDHGANLQRGLIIHLPAGQAHCDLVWVDLTKGWEAVQVAKQVREQRAHKFHDLTEVFTPGLDPTSNGEKKAAEREVAEVEQRRQRLERMIRACDTSDAVRALWADHAGEWDDALTEVARAHVTSLPESA